MSEQEKLKEKLSSFFEEKLSSLQKKFTNDIEKIEKLKYEFVDNCIKNLDKELKEREIRINQEEHHKKHEKEHGDIKEKKHNENKDKKHEKEHKEEHKIEKEIIKKTHPLKRNSVDITRSKTPIKELKQKNKILKLDKSVDRIPEKIKDKEKNKNYPIKVLKQSSTIATTIQRDKDRDSTPTGKNLNKKVHKGKDNKNVSSNTKNKKEGKVKEKNDKNTPIKNNNNSIKKNENQNDDNKNEEKKENEVKDLNKKVEIIIKEKPIINIPENIKNSKELSCLYIILKDKFISSKDKFNIIISIKPIYESYNKDIKFLLDDRINELKDREEKINKIFNNYPDIEKYLNQLFNPSRIAFKSLTYITKEEEENLTKKDSIPKEITIIFKLLR